ncbi:MAG: RidA family protein [Burkholderiaceae bacterium]
MRVIYSDQLMQPIAHFSHATRVQQLVHVGATAGTDAQRRLAGACVGTTDLDAQTISMFDNLETVLGLMGAKASELLRVKLYVTETRDMARCAALFEERYGASGLRPVVVGSAGFPLPHAMVELDAVALIGSTPKMLAHAGVAASGTDQRCHLLVLPEAATTGTVPRGIRAQIEHSLANLRRAVDACGMKLGDVVSVHLTLADPGDLPAVEAALAPVLSQSRPACTVVGAPLSHREHLLQLEVLCVRGGGTPVQAPGASCVLRGGSPAVLSGDELHIGSQTGVRDGSSSGSDGRSGSGTASGTGSGAGANSGAAHRADDDGVHGQTRRAFDKVAALLQAAGMSTEHLMRTNNVLVDWRDYAGFNLGYGANVTRPYPPRATVLGTLAVADARVQIEGSAHRRLDEFVRLDRPPDGP